MTKCKYKITDLIHLWKDYVYLVLQPISVNFGFVQISINSGQNRFLRALFHRLQNLI